MAAHHWAQVASLFRVALAPDVSTGVVAVGVKVLDPREGLEMTMLSPSRVMVPASRVKLSSLPLVIVGTSTCPVHELSVQLMPSTNAPCRGSTAVLVPSSDWP